jgi:hypothetical protein
MQCGIRIVFFDSEGFLHMCLFLMANCQLAVLNVGCNALQTGGLREKPKKYGALMIGFCVMMRSQVM